METNEIKQELSQLSAQITMVSIDIDRLSKVRQELIEKFTPLYKKLAPSADCPDTPSNESIND